MDLNRIYNMDCLEGMKEIPDKSIDLAIIDPPYYKVVNEKWDYLWANESEYIQWSLKYLLEIFRVLRIGGSLYLFGYFRILALLVSHFKDIGFELRQQIVITKGLRSVAGRATKQYKLFPNVTESCLFMIKDNKPFVKEYLKTHQELKKLSAKEINTLLGVKSNGGGMWSIYTGDNVCKQFPTKEIWNRLSSILGFDLSYESIAQTFNPIMGITDVWDDIDFYNEDRNHPTQKPVKLIKRLIQASSNKGDTVLDPFMGSGTTAVAAVMENRKFIGFETNSEYCEVANKRLRDLTGPFYIYGNIGI